MPQGPQGPQKCFLVPSDNGSYHPDPVARRQVPTAPANPRLQIARSQPAAALPKPAPVRVAITKPTTAERPRLKHAAVAPVPVADVHRRQMAKALDEIWPNWRVPAGIRNPYSPDVTKMLGAMAMGEVVGGSSAVGLVLPIKSWRTQGDDYLACFRTCLIMIGKTNSDVPPDFKSSISMVRERGVTLIKQPGYQQGLSIINSFLKQKKPIIVGINRKFGKNFNNDDTTDHFVVIVASGSDKKGFYYRFFDPGTKHIEKGTNEMNRMYLDKATGLFIGTSAYNAAKGVTYTLTWARPAIK